MEDLKVKNHRLYFGRTMRFVDDNGNVYDAAFNVKDSQTDIITKTVTLRSIWYKSIQSFEAGEPPIPKIDGGIKELIYRSENWDKLMLSMSDLVFSTAQTIHSVFDAVKDVPKGDGTFESQFVGASAIILPEEV